MKCDSCGEEFDPEQAAILFKSEVESCGQFAYFDLYYEKDLCFECNRDNWWGSYEERLKNDPEEREAFDSIWGWATDESC